MTKMGITPQNMPQLPIPLLSPTYYEVTKGNQ